MELTGDSSGLKGSRVGLHGDSTNLKGDCSKLHGDCTNINGDCTGLYGDCSGLFGDCSGLQGRCSGLQGNCSDSYGDCTNWVNLKRHFKIRTVEQSVELLWCTPEPEKQIEIAGRTCYKSEDKITATSAYDFCKRMVKSRHLAMIEHAVASFKIVTDRGISHEIVRHRLASYAQESPRYCNYSKDKFANHCTFVRPFEPQNEQKNKVWEKACVCAEEAYFLMLEQGQPAQTARAVLPTCLKTEIVMTANLREFRHFITLRKSKAAHPQIRIIAQKMLSELVEIAPSIFEDL